MKKRRAMNCLLFLVLFLIIPSFAAAQSNATEPVDKAYECLQAQIDSKETDVLSLQEAVFSTLALGSQTKLIDRIEQDKSNENCWPSSSCTIKDTSQTLLAYDRVNKNTANIEGWIFSKNMSTSNIDWFLQIDIANHQPSECSLFYDGAEHTANIGDDMKITGNPGSCLLISPSGFWLKVKENCFDKEIRVSCNQDFITSLLYQKSGAATVYISPNTHSAPSLGTTIEEVSSKCFKTGANCDYEGSLWAAISLSKKGHDVSPFMPYLFVFAEDNERFLPSSFLYMVTEGNDQYSKLVQSQRQNQFWEAPSTPYNRFYDTSLALLALQRVSASEVNNAKSYLLSVQTQEGCWDNNNIRNTAFLLYAGWPTTTSSAPGADTITYCTEVPEYSCTSVFGCSDAGGNVLTNYACLGAGQVCCSVTPQQPTCAEQGGQICSSGTVCPAGSVVSSAELGTCCLSACEPEPVPEENICEGYNIGTCAFSCSSGEEQTFDSCGEPSLVCCTKAEKAGNLTWIIVLIILIIIVLLAIIYRKKLQLWWFNFKNKKKGGPPPRPAGPRYPPAYPPNMRPPNRFSPQRFPVRPVGPARPVPQRKPQGSREDKEFEETLKKLKEMSK